ncbi:MAG: ABC transporter permease [Pseudomonadota bacterium]
MRTGALVDAAVGVGLGKSALVAAGVAACTVLVLVLFAGYRSLNHGVESYAGRAGSDLWIAPPGTDNMIRSGGYIPASWETRLRALAGVAAVDPVLRTFAAVETAAPHSLRLTLLAIGYRGPAGMGGPSSIRIGRPPRAAGEVVIDRAAAFRLGVGVGDEVRVNEVPLRIVGLSDGTNLIGTQFLFGDYASAVEAVGVAGRTSFFVVRLAEGADAEERAQAVRRLLPGASVMTRREFLRNNLREVAAGLVPLLAVLAGLGLGVASALVGLLVEGLVENRKTDLAVLLALGAGTRSIGTGLARAVAKVLGAGLLLGAAAALALGLVLERWMPTVELTFRLADLAWASCLFGAAGLAAIAVPLARLGRIDPLEAFRP